MNSWRMIFRTKKLSLRFISIRWTNSNFAFSFFSVTLTEQTNQTYIFSFWLRSVKYEMYEHALSYFQTVNIISKNTIDMIPDLMKHTRSFVDKLTNLLNGQTILSNNVSPILSRNISECVANLEWNIKTHNWRKIEIIQNCKIRSTIKFCWKLFLLTYKHYEPKM